MNAAIVSGFENLAGTLGLAVGLFWILLLLVVIWTITIKGFALWHAARNYQYYWFIALLLLNTIGILEVIYLLWFRADKDKGKTPSLFTTPEGPVST